MHAKQLYPNATFLDSLAELINGVMLLPGGVAAAFVTALQAATTIATLRSGVEGLAVPAEYRALLTHLSEHLQGAFDQSLFSPGVSAIQTLVIGGTPVGGTWTFTDTRPGGLTSAGIAVGASAATVQTQADAVFGLGKVVVSRTGSTPNYSYPFAFGGYLAYQPIAAITMDVTSLTGGSPTGVVTQSTLGVTAQNAQAPAIVAMTTVNTAAAATDLLYSLCTRNDARLDASYYGHAWHPFPAVP